MKKINLLFAVMIISCSIIAQVPAPVAVKKAATLPSALVDFDAFDSLTSVVKKYRKDRLVHLDQFVAMSKEKNTVILDTRSKDMYQRKHVKGAIHLAFTDFTQENLRRVIPSNTTRILIYCNNNFDDDPILFATKSYQPPMGMAEKKPLTLALNIPTFINLYGYGYKNVYELKDLVTILFNRVIEFEGTDVPKTTTTTKSTAVPR